MPLSSLSCQLFIATDHGYSEQVEAYCQQNFGSLTIHRGGRSEPFPESAYDWSGDLIISYVSRWIIPESVLNQAQLAAINFHPGSPDYPGTGCINFALYDEAKAFGATWKKNYSRKELNQLSLISATDTEDEVRRKIRATSFGPWQPRIELRRHTFQYKSKPY